MYTSPRYSPHNTSGTQNYGSSPNRQNGYGHSPSKYGMVQQQQQKQQQQQQPQYGSYDAPYSPPTKGHSYHPVYSNGFSNNNSQNNAGETMYYEQNQYYHHQRQQHTVDGHYYYSGSSVSSSQDGGYYMDEMDDMDNVDPEMTTIPTVPTPIGLSKYEHGKTPSGRVLVTSGNQTVEFFSCVVNAPRELYAAE